MIATRIIDLDRLQNAYRVRRKPDAPQQLEWLGIDEDSEVVLDAEPDSSWWQRIKLMILRPLIPETLL